MYLSSLINLIFVNICLSWIASNMYVGVWGNKELKVVECYNCIIIGYERGIQGRHSSSQARTGRGSRETHDCIKYITSSVWEQLSENTAGLLMIAFCVYFYFFTQCPNFLGIGVVLCPHVGNQCVQRVHMWVGRFSMHCSWFCLKGWFWYFAFLSTGWSWTPWATWTCCKYPHIRCNTYMVKWCQV